MKIKEIKIKEDDGSYSDPIPMGAMAKDIEYEDTNVKSELDKLNTYNNTQDAIINILKVQISKLVNGSAMIVNKMSDMTDTSRIYVNTVDNHWYYYYNGRWNDGGSRL